MPPTRITSQETRRLFGPVNRPAFDTNVRHRALLRKAIELFRQEVLIAIFGQPIKLRLAMGLAFTSGQFGKIKTNYVENDRLVSRETQALELEAREQLGRYRDRYDAYFKSRGNNYDIRDPNALAGLQAAEQDWHDWVVVYLEELYGIIGRPDWALQPLPGLQMVRFTPGQVQASVARTRTRLPPTPPPSSPVRPRKMKFLGVVDISDDEDEQPLRKKTKVFIDLTL
ncbi:hypothetical protein GGX14DRAFT_394607 [Mycena pura]|uniref:Uncharacterized protein n=1 Tax=Mycena pura TaxID=153505 RepID=A0AAD6VG14_9AGAR|nr:hypothetical protein GGX14DRAFT_394607 [Mycena pura]